MSTTDLSVFSLITTLSNQFAKKQTRYNAAKYTKVLRSKVYDILLYKKQEDGIEKVNGYKCITSIYNKIRAWLFTMKNVYGYDDVRIDKLECYVNHLEQFGNELTENVLLLLFQLRNSTIFHLDDDPFTLKIDKDCPFHVYNMNDFKMQDLKAGYRNYSNNSFKLNMYDQDLFLLISKDKIKDNDQLKNVKEIEADEPSIDVWECIMDSYTEVEEKSWESRFSYNQTPSLSFLSESSTNYNLSLCFLNDESISNVLSLEDYLHDVINVLVGISSKSFKLDDNGQFNKVYTSIKGINQAVLRQHSEIYINCGNKFIQLDRLIKQNAGSQVHLQRSFICEEFQNCIEKYLIFYNNFVFTISVKNTLDNVKLIAEKLHSQLNIFTDITNNVFPEDATKIDSVKLLNYLYNKLINFSNVTIKMVLFLLYPCFQVYYSHFLHSWLFDGLLNDPYNEFFILCKSKYVTKHDRSYWKKCFMINESKVPTFLIDVKDQILLCGKSVQILKICNSNLKKKDESLAIARPTLTCCITHEKLQDYIFNVNKYNLKILELFGKPFTFSEVFLVSDENRDKFLTMVAYKRTTTLKRIELEKINKLKKENERKQKELTMLKEQYYEVLRQKRSNLLMQMAREIQESEINLQMKEIQNQVIEEEAKNMIDYYENLMQEADLRRRISEQQVLKWKAVQLYIDDNFKPAMCKTKSDVDGSLLNTEENVIVQLEEDANCNKDILTPGSFKDSNEDTQLESSLANNNIVVEEETNRTSSLDVMNANVPRVNETIKIALDNFEIARKNKAKVMSSEFDVLYKEPEKKNKSIFTMSDNLTEAQRNKLKVMSSEYHINYARNLSGEESIHGGGDSNHVVVNKNNINNNSKKRSTNLVLDFTHLKTRPIFEEFLKPPNFELPKPSPMSIDSTPMSDLTPLSNIRFAKSDISEYGSPSDIGTATSSKDGFNFYVNNNNDNVESYDVLMNRTFSKITSLSLNDIKEINESQIQSYIEQSIKVLLSVQYRFVNNEFMRYYVEELKYLQLLKTLKNYFFLMDGEFCRNLTESLFEKIYEINNPSELLNISTLQLILQSSYNYDEVSDNLSFKINRIPKRFDLRDPNLLKCFSLTYKVNWPLNILLPIDAIEKYNEIFHFLMKLQRITWILKRVFMDLKMLTKQLGRKSAFLTLSPQYQALYRYRHVMTQFIQSFQNYIVGDVLHTSWKSFETALTSASSVDSIYESHTQYIKSILSMCFLTEASAPLRDVLHKIFVTIFKFYDYLRSRLWSQDDDGTYIHPNYKKLEGIYLNFKELAVHFYKVVKKAIKSVHHGQLNKLIISWDINNYYQLNVNTSATT